MLSPTRLLYTGNALIRHDLVEEDFCMSSCDAFRHPMNFVSFLRVSQSSVKERCFLDINIKRIRRQFRTQA